MSLGTRLQGIRRKLRWLTGRGWSADDFAERYAGRSSDAWGYRASPAHRDRAEWIAAALPEPRFSFVLEVGCAEGFLTERLAARADRLIACDIAAPAVERTRVTCRSRSNVEVRIADIRSGFPGEGFDLCLCSDVLYYLSPREIDAVLAEAGKRIAPCGYLLIANEWRDDARGLTPPSYALGRLDRDSSWERVDSRQSEIGDMRLVLATYRRTLV